MLTHISYKFSRPACRSRYQSAKYGEVERQKVCQKVQCADNTHLLAVV